LGAPEDLSRVLVELELHGMTVDQIVIMQPFEQLSKTAQEALLDVERTTAIRVEWLLETLGWRGTEADARTKNTLPKTVLPPSGVDGGKPPSLGPYPSIKRVIDLVSVICLILALSPLLALVALLVAIDVGLPVVFWQQRPGRYGRPFKLFKFRTMRPAHDAHGHRIAEELRSSEIGSFLRRSRLDELPQLYNILTGEMSLVGPRPLLPVDQPEGHMPRLVARPGLTGWAQVNGGREISPQDKAALDVWYIENASLWLDITILLRTLAIVISGDRVNGMAVRAAHAGLEEMKTKPTVESARCAQEAV
jgi:lipopolysaccharide/colanic/teichoic acid biosynthesis glycosyltransferase